MDDRNPFEATLLNELGHVQVLGQTDDHTVLLHDRQRRALLRIRNLESLRLATAVQLLGPRVLDLASGKESLSPLRGRVARAAAPHPGRLRGESAEGAYPNRISQEAVLAQGCHWFGDDWLVVSGTRAVSSCDGPVDSISWRGGGARVGRARGGPPRSTPRTFWPSWPNILNRGRSRRPRLRCSWPRWCWPARYRPA